MEVPVGQATNYRNLEVYQLAFDLAVEIDRMSKSFPRHELFEIGSQIRRSAKSVPANLAEGYGRRRYKQDYIRFIVYALASCDETQVHLDMLRSTGSLDDDSYQRMHQQYVTLGKKLNRFLQGVIQHHREPYR
ncbi:MAG: four helix bundle protein [Anaerolineae bacterium]|nr:four helix bundle protein [Anaerolineae bacterium]